MVVFTECKGAAIGIAMGYRCGNDCGSSYDFTWIEGGKGMVTVNGIIVESITADNMGNVYFVAAGDMELIEGRGGIVPHVAWHYDKRTDELNMIISNVSYADCLAATVKYREGVSNEIY